MPRRMRVAVPALDVRAVPQPAGPTLDRDPAQETQLLYGELVLVHERHGEWARIEAVEQPEWSHHQRWEGYPGWVEARGLVPDNPTWIPYRIARTMALGLRTTAARRRIIVDNARHLIGIPYYWGGRSPRVVDCSGLVNLCYRAAGVGIPRDAHEQSMRARTIPCDRLRPADLVFLSDPHDPQQVTHVMLYAADGRVIEGPGTGSHVREIALEERLALPTARGRRVACGTYFK